MRGDRRRRLRGVVGGDPDDDRGQQAQRDHDGGGDEKPAAQRRVAGPLGELLGRVLAVVEVRDGAVATSGAAHRGAHVVDARTGAAPGAVAQVTVTAASLTDADVDATAAYALDERAAEWLAHRVGRAGLVVWADGTTATVGDGGIGR